MLLLFGQLPVVMIAAYFHGCAVRRTPPAVFLPGAACRDGRVSSDVERWKAQAAKRPDLSAFRSEIVPRPNYQIACSRLAARDSVFSVPTERPICRAADKLCVVATAHPHGCPVSPTRLPGASPAWTPTREGLRPSSGLSPNAPQRGGKA